MYFLLCLIFGKSFLLLQELLQKQKFVFYSKYTRPIFGQIEFTPKRSVRKTGVFTNSLVSLSEILVI